MAPFGFLAAAVSCFARRTLGVVSCTSPLPRYTTVLPATSITLLKYLSSEPSGRPKKPMSGFMKYLQKQRPVTSTQYPDLKYVDVIRKVAEQWRKMSPEEKQPFQAAFLQEREKYVIDIQQYKAQLSPAQVQQIKLDKLNRAAKRTAILKKQELVRLGKPKGPRSAYNIYISEHYEESRGTSAQAKLKSLMEDWKNLLSHKKQVYTQLAEDDKVRYKNEMNSWSSHLVEIGREDLIKKATTKKGRATVKSAKKSTGKTVIRRS